MKVKKVRNNAILPQRASALAAGYDMCACIDEPVTIRVGERALIGTGIAMEIDADKAVFIYGRSGLGSKFGMAPSNCVGVIDADYRGEVSVSLTNHGDKDYTINPKDRIAQMVISQIFTPELELVDELSETERGEGGFGHSGIAEIESSKEETDSSREEIEYYVYINYGIINPFTATLYEKRGSYPYEIDAYSYDSRKSGHLMSNEEYYQKVKKMIGDFPVKNIYTNFEPLAKYIENQGEFTVKRNFSEHEE